MSPREVLGRQHLGQLGDGTDDAATSAVSALGLSNVVQVATTPANI